MPTYHYQCTSCENMFSDILLMAEKDKPTQEPCIVCGENTVHQVIMSAPNMGDPVYLGVRKNPAGWGELMKRIQHNNPGSKIYDNQSFDHQTPEQ